MMHIFLQLTLTVAFFCSVIQYICAFTTRIKFSCCTENCSQCKVWLSQQCTWLDGS